MDLKHPSCSQYFYTFFSVIFLLTFWCVTFIPCDTNASGPVSGKLKDDSSGGEKSIEAKVMKSDSNKAGSETDKKIQNKVIEKLQEQEARKSKNHNIKKIERHAEKQQNISQAEGETGKKAVTEKLKHLEKVISDLKDAFHIDLNANESETAQHIHDFIQKLEKFEQQNKEASVKIKQLEREKAQEFIKENALEAKALMFQDEVNALSEKLHNPKISQWLQARADYIGSLFGSKNTARALGQVFEGVVKVGEKIREVESGVEKGVEQNLKKISGKHDVSVAAYILSSFVFFIPVFLLGYGTIRISQAISTRQFVLLGLLFYFVYFQALIIVYIFIRRDPIQLLSTHHRLLMIILHISFVIQFPCFMFLLGLALLVSRTKRQRLSFLAQCLLFLIIAVDYGGRVWLPSFSDKFPVKHSFVAYFVYMCAFLLMIYLTIRAARVGRDEELVQDVDNLFGNFDGLTNTFRSRRQRMRGISPESEESENKSF